MSHEPIYGQSAVPGQAQQAAAPAGYPQAPAGYAPQAPAPQAAPAPQGYPGQPQVEQAPQAAYPGQAPQVTQAPQQEVYQPQVQGYPSGVPGQPSMEENNHFAPLPVAQPPEIAQATLANPEALQYAQQVASGQAPQAAQYPGQAPQQAAPQQAPVGYNPQQGYPGQASQQAAPQQAPVYPGQAAPHQAPVGYNPQQGYPGQAPAYPGQAPAYPGQATPQQGYAPGQSVQPYVNNATISATPTGHPLKTKFVGRGILVSVTTMDSKKGNKMCRGLINAVPDDRNSKANNFICFSKTSSYQIDIINDEQLRPNYTAMTKTKGEPVIFEGSWEENNYNNQITIQLMVDKFHFENDPNLAVRAESYIPPLPPNPMDMLNGGAPGMMYPGQAPQGYPQPQQGGYPGQAPQGYPQAAPAPQGYPQPQQGYPQAAPAPQGYPGQAPAGYAPQPQAAPQGYPQPQQGVPAYPGAPMPQ